jgi:hypothetical protein
MQKDYFEYDKENLGRRYDSLKLEALFRYESTYKALRWGIVVGAMFGGHRYYRSRSIENAAFWFTSMSALSFINIWLSFSL